MVGRNRSVITEPPPPVLHTNDDQTEDWCMATPRVRMKFQVEPRTPEMPDMSSVTQDILKVRNYLFTCYETVPRKAIDAKRHRQFHILTVTIGELSVH